MTTSNGHKKLSDELECEQAVVSRMHFVMIQIVLPAQKSIFGIFKFNWLFFKQRNCGISVVFADCW